MTRVMSYTDVRQARAHLEEMRKLWPDQLVEVPESEWPPTIKERMTHPPVGVLRSKEFLVQVYQEPNDILRLSINRCRINDDGSWGTNISWEELQEIKRQAGLGGLDAVEVFPCDHDIVNVANMRHLWVLPRPLGFAWRKPRIETATIHQAPKDMRA